MSKEKVKLSIVIITMNRAKQIIAALESCIKSRLPKETEFIIVDNGSVDDTEEKVTSFFNEVEYSLNYIKMEENVGISEGRNVGYRAAFGEIVYNMDDDAIINKDFYETFFIKALEFLENNPKVATLTTEVYDECLDKWRESKKAKSYSDTYPLIFAFHGNNYFIRKNIEGMEYIPTIRYAYEDVYLSILALDKGYINVLCEGINIIHRPLVNKWVKGTDSYNEIIVKANAALLSIKILLYPNIYKPLIFFGFFLRWLKHGRNIKGSLKKSYELYKLQITGIKVHKIKHKTVIKIFREFGIESVI